MPPCSHRTVATRTRRSKHTSRHAQRAAKLPDLSQFGSLAEYNRKRHFCMTPEPEGRTRAGNSASRAFVVQKHAASHLHYDVRLEYRGVMLSWAVPKGPSLQPGVKRLAMRTEDHPVDYNQFEGVIPEGEYGAGTVMIWDNGTWEPEYDTDEELDDAIRIGRIRFTLHGSKLKGSWMLVRAGDEQRWLLMKQRDAYALAGRDVTIELPRSAVSRRGMASIARAGGGTPEQRRRALIADTMPRSR